MSKKRGLSLEEKRDKVLEVFYESKDVFNLKDVEKLASKKGVVLQSVKEVLQSLVDDDMVKTDKIGISNVYWAFPSEAGVRLESELGRLTKQLAELQSKRSALEAELEKESAAKQDTADRRELASRMGAMEAENRSLKAETAAYAENDPEVLERMSAASESARKAANRWMDNLWAVQSWAKKQFGDRGDEMKRWMEEMGLTDSLDYV